VPCWLKLTLGGTDHSINGPTHAGRGRQQQFEVLDGDRLIFVKSTGSGRVVVGWTRPEQTTNLAHHCTHDLATAAK
jgi:hypothetical protein